MFEVFKLYLCLRKDKVKAVFEYYNVFAQPSQVNQTLPRLIQNANATEELSSSRH